MNSENSKTSDRHRLLLNLTDKIDLRRKNILPYQILAFTTNGKNFKKSCKNNKSKISIPIWNVAIELPDQSYSISDIQDCFEYILKKHEEKIVDPSIRIYTNKIENRIMSIVNICS